MSEGFLTYYVVSLHPTYSTVQQVISVRDKKWTLYNYVIMHKHFANTEIILCINRANPVMHT